MSVSLTHALGPHYGEVWQLERAERGLVLRAGPRVMATIPDAEASVRIHFPSLFAGLFLTIDGDSGQRFDFEPDEKDLVHVRELVAACFNKTPEAAADTVSFQGSRHLFIGCGSIVMGLTLTVCNFLTAVPGGRFAIMLGLLGVGLVEVIRGICFKASADLTYDRARENAARWSKPKAENPTAGGRPDSPPTTAIKRDPRS